MARFRALGVSLSPAKKLILWFECTMQDGKDDFKTVYRIPYASTIDRCDNSTRMPRQSLNLTLAAGSLARNCLYLSLLSFSFSIKERKLYLTLYCSGPAGILTHHHSIKRSRMTVKRVETVSRVINCELTG